MRVPFCLLLFTSFTSLSLAEVRRAEDETKPVSLGLLRKNYVQKNTALGELRAKLSKQYQSANAANKNKIVKATRAMLEKELVERVMPAWYGTAWDFNGITQTPGKGKIACGYFVTTTVRDLGFKIHRIKLAQQASIKIIKQLCDKKSIKVIHNKPIGDVESYLKRHGEGVYIVGLDSHVGYITYRAGKMKFVHADYYDRATGVKAEDLTGHNPLNDSKYRMIGKLFHDQMVKNWLLKHQYPKP